MMFSRADIEKMDEATLRTDVLIPLFKAMGYLDVCHYHGGSQEQGKDIVMWSPDKLRGRMNVAVVAKAAPISGKVTGRSSAGEVAIQALQCFGASFHDIVTLEDRHVDRCIVVCSHRVTKEARIAIANALRESKNDGRVDIIDGDKLWALVQEYFGPARAIERLREAGEILEGASDHFRITAAVGGQGIVLAPEPKRGSSEVESLTFRVRFAFPQTPEGGLVLGALRSHIETGAPVTIPGAFIQEIAAPEFLRPFLGTDGAAKTLVLGVSQLRKAIVTAVIFKSENGQVFRFDNIELRGVQAGTQEITLNNDHQPIPWRFGMRLHFGERRLQFNYSATSAGMNVKHQLQVARLEAALAAGAVVLVEGADSGITVEIGRVQSGLTTAPPDGLITFLENLVDIQTYARARLSMPEEEMSREDVEAVYDLADRLRRGLIEGTTDSLNVTLTREGAEQILRSADVLHQHPMEVEEEQVWTILGTQVPVGKVTSTITGLQLTEAARVDLERCLKDEPERTDFPVVLTPLEGSAKVTARYWGATRSEEAGGGIESGGK